MLLQAIEGVEGVVSALKQVFQDIDATALATPSKSTRIHGKTVYKSLTKTQVKNHQLSKVETIVCHNSCVLSKYYTLTDCACIQTEE